MLLVGTAVTMMIASDWAKRAWPWALTPITRGAIGAWLIGLGVAAGHAWLINDKPSLRPLGLTGVTFGLLQAVALTRYGNELDWASTPAIAYVATIVALTLVSGWALLPLPRRPTGADHAVAVPVRLHSVAAGSSCRLERRPGGATGDDIAVQQQTSRSEGACARLQ